MEGKINVVELFAGAGGLAQGFIKNSAFQLTALLDVDHNAGETFRRNFPSVYYEISDICNLAPALFHKKMGKEKIQGLIGGPPCQGFSAAGKREVDDRRNLLALEYLKFVDFFKPDFLVLENVPQFLRHKIYKDLVSSLDAKYYLVSGILNAAFYGVPQTRLRAVIVGFRKKTKIKPTLPFPTHGPLNPLFGYRSKRIVNPYDSMEEILGINATIHIKNVYGTNLIKEVSRPFVTIEEAIGDLPSLEAGEYSDIYLTEPATSYQKNMRGLSTALYNHVARGHDCKVLELFRHLPEGGDLNDLDAHFHPAKHFSQAYSRLHRQGLARTITNSFQNPGSGRFTHYRDNRTLTVREAARLQGFSDDFIFVGNQAEKLKYVGNAVPVKMAEVIAEHICSLLEDYYQYK